MTTTGASGAILAIAPSEFKAMGTACPEGVAAAAQERGACPRLAQAVASATSARGRLCNESLISS